MIAFDNSQWDIQAKTYRFEEYLGEQCLFLQEGTAFLEDIEFLDGIIEYDVAFGPERGFVGVLWCVADEENYEEFYMRPHQSGNPDALQYTPIYKGMAGWQLYSGEGFTGVAHYAYNEWVHVKLVVSGSQAEVYIGDSEEPVFFMHNLMRSEDSGGIGFKAGPFTSAHFANLQVTALEDAPPLKSAPRQVEHPSNTIPEWNVSNPVAESLWVDELQITEDIRDELTWEITVSEDSGLVNLAKVNRWSRKKDTSVAQCRLVSEKAQMKRLQFGFSDKIKVYLNDQLLFSGDDAAFSRDYRFLGTVGFYHELCLDLQAGDNELWMVVTESRPPAGWGVQARLTDMDGITSNA